MAGEGAVARVGGGQRAVVVAVPVSGQTGGVADTNLKLVVRTSEELGG